MKCPHGMGSRRLLASASFALIAFFVFAVAVQTAQAAPPGAFYEHKQGTGLARATCSKRMPVIGGGGFVESPAGIGFKDEALRQAYPISDMTGVIAFGNSAIGYQAASSDFTDIVAAFSICAAPSLASEIDVQYVSAQSVGVADAFCPASAVLLGGGGFVETPPNVNVFQSEKLRQSFPISDATGVIAFGTTGIGWQAASSNFQDTVVAFAVCAMPRPGFAVVAHYVSAQDVGVARAFCSAGLTLTGGGGFVEQPIPNVFQEEALRQTYPISDPTGVIAHGTKAIGWQAASSNFADTVASFAICTSY